MSLHGNLYKLARAANNANALLHPKRLPNRVKNILIGRALGRSGIWKWPK
jgi:hypothetical protein